MRVTGAPPRSDTRFSVARGGSPAKNATDSPLGEKKGEAAQEQREAQDPRIQLFDESGDLLEVWSDLGMSRPTGITIASDDTVYVGDTDGNAIWVLKDGRVLEKIGDLEARPHNIVLDSGTGALYMADTTEPGQIKRITRK